jgi:hypothetical protein
VAIVTMTNVSRTVDQNQVVDEIAINFRPKSARGPPLFAID